MSIRPDLTIVQPRPWVYNIYSSDTDAACFGRFEGFVALWKSKLKPNQSVPTWDSFDFMDFRGWWGRISLAELLEDPVDLRFRIWGTTLADWWGVDYSWSRLSQKTKFPKEWKLSEARYFKAFSKAPAIGYFCGTLDAFNRGYHIVEGIDLPLGPEGRIEYILTLFMLSETGKAGLPDAPPIFRLSDFD